MDTELDNATGEDIRRELNDNNKQITQYNDANNKLLINLYYKSLIENYLNTIVIPRSEKAMPSTTVSAESQMHEQLLYLKQNIVSKYTLFKSGNEDIIVDLLSDFQTLQNILEKEFLFQKERNVIKTQHTNLIPYLKEIFNSYQQFQEINTLIKQKQERDTKIQELCDKNDHLEKILILSANPDQLTQEEMQIKMQTQETTPSKPRPHNIFLLVCHGASVSQFKNYFRTRIYCKNIEYLVDHVNTLYLRGAPDRPGIVTQEDVDAFQKFRTKLTRDPSDDTDDIDKYLDDYRGSYKDDRGKEYKKNEVLESDNEYAYLPPMFFSPITTDEIEEKTQLYDNVMGLYHYIINPGNDKYYLAHVIADYSALKAKVKEYGDSLTYSSITSLIRNYLRSVNNGEITLTRKEHTDYIKESYNKKDIFDNSSIKFFTCRSYYKQQLIDKNLLEFFNSQVVVNYEPEPVTFFDSFDKDDNISLFTINLERFNLQQAKEKWQGPLAGLYHQGCGLNVINFYGLMDTIEARSTATCLNMGTSIFKIADYIVKNNSQYLPTDGFGVCRLEIVNYCKLINRLINNIVKNRSITSTFIGNKPFGDLLFMFRIYETNFKGKTEEYNDIGHVASIALKDNSIHFIDPQAQRSLSKEYDFSYVDKETISEFLVSIFTEHYPDKKFCDFYIYKRSFSILTFTQLQQDYGCVLRPRPPKLSFGGKNTIKKRQRVLKTHKKPRNYTVKIKKHTKNIQKKHK